MVTSAASFVAEFSRPSFVTSGYFGCFQSLITEGTSTCVLRSNAHLVTFVRRVITSEFRDEFTISIRRSIVNVASDENEQRLCKVIDGRILLPTALLQKVSQLVNIHV
jgi:hypothetical protein